MIYEGQDIINELNRRDYYESILAKVVFEQSDIPGEWKWQPASCNREYSFHASFPAHDRIGNPFKCDIIEGDHYIISVYNRFHSQLMMPAILMVNFNCTKRQMLEYWDVCQSCWFQNRNDLEYDENGKVLPQQAVSA